jgi:ferredoxin-NADP reductase
VRYTLVHTNRTPKELAYHDQLLVIEAAARFDFTYLPTVSRLGAEPGQRLGSGRANNVLRSLFQMPLKEEEDLRSTGEEDKAAARAALERAVRPRLPGHIHRDALLERMPPGETVLLSCGNPSSMRDIRLVAESNGMRFEKEDWKQTACA